MENSSINGNIRPLYLPPEKSVCRSRNNSHRSGCGTLNDFKLGKEYVKAILSPCLFNLYAEYIMQNPRLDEVQAGIKITRGNISNLRYADDITLVAQSKEELESPDKSERGE